MLELKKKLNKSKCSRMKTLGNQQVDYKVQDNNEPRFVTLDSFQVTFLFQVRGSLLNYYYYYYLIYRQPLKNNSIFMQSYLFQVCSGRAILLVLLVYGFVLQVTVFKQIHFWLTSYLPPCGVWVWQKVFYYTRISPMIHRIF